MPEKTSQIIQLSNPDYIRITKDSSFSYGGSQMWFPHKNWLRKDYILYNYGCGTIAAADFFLYLALQKEAYRSPETNIVLQGNRSISYNDYYSYVHRINDRYTKTHRVIAVLGPKLASALESYARVNSYQFHAAWKWSLGYYDMYDMIEEMLSEDIPVILSIGPNTPLLWGGKGIPFYEREEIENALNLTDAESAAGELRTHYYKEVMQNINSHYVTVTALIKDDEINTIMLRISSWGKQFYINYEEYRNYIEETSGTYTSSLVYVNKA